MCAYRIKNSNIVLVYLTPLVSLAQVRTLGEMFSHLGDSFPSFGMMLIASAYVSGIGFGIAAAYKFKQYKDNPTQIPIGTPIALIIVSTLLIFLPTISRPAANSLFGTTTGSGWFINENINCLPGHNC